MACYHPIPARREDAGAPWKLNPPLGQADAEVPCGTCLGCRTARQHGWATRAVHEARLWEHNRFITLTYRPEEVPRELQPADLQKFLKRLRKRAEYDDTIITTRSASIRYMACGQYGDTTQRPHYHLCAFNLALRDERRYDADQTTSETLESIWGKGTAKLAPFIGARAGYVAGYATKTGRRTYYDADGILHPPFFRASSRPALGKDWLTRFRADAENGYLIIDGRKHPVPRYYRKWLLQHSPAYKENTTNKQKKWLDDYSELRRQAAEQIHHQYHERRRRDIDSNRS